MSSSIWAHQSKFECMHFSCGPLIYNGQTSHLPQKPRKKFQLYLYILGISEFLIFQIGNFVSLRVHAKIPSKSFNCRDAEILYGIRRLKPRLLKTSNVRPAKPKRRKRKIDDSASESVSVASSKSIKMKRVILFLNEKYFDHNINFLCIVYVAHIRFP